MSKMTQAYIDGNIRWANLDREIIDLEVEEVNTDSSKLSKRLEMEKIKDKTVIGITETKKVLILLHSNNTFTGVIWETRTPLSGSYTLL